MGVDYDTVEGEIRRGAVSIADLQRSTGACTRCFGCRHELEQMLESALGGQYQRAATITLPEGRERATVPRPMYIPVLTGFRGGKISTRIIVFNADESGAPAGFRLDLLGCDGERVSASHHQVASGCSTVVDLGEAAQASLPEGLGVAKLLLEVEGVGSLRPYFQFLTDTCITSTHEKTGAPRPEVRKGRNYHWIFPIGTSPFGEEAYFFCTNTHTDPMAEQRLVWQTDDGRQAVAPMPHLEFDQTACVALHELFPAILAGNERGVVRLEPASHVVAGFMIRHNPARQLWRVQHL
jgi:bacterioferritin-associated ferredoxin